MSRLFGDIFQLAYVVDDLEAACLHWSQKLGVGPFYRFPLPLPFETVSVRGEQLPPDVDIFKGVAVSYSGDMMIELIEPGRAASPYREFLSAGRQGVHHVGTFATDYDAQLAAAKAASITVAFEGKLPLSRFAYLDTDILFPGTMVEMIEPTQIMLDLFAEIKSTARNWDGLDPIRDM